MQTATEEADRLARRRARMSVVMGIYFLAGQAIFLFNDSSFGTTRIVDRVRLGGWLAWAVVLMVGLATGGLWRNRAVRDLLNDEGTRLHRARAFAWGFWAAMAMGIAVHVVAMFEPITALEAVHLIVSAGVGVAVLRFGIQERRALADG